MGNRKAADAGRKFVRVTGCRATNLIEFDFAVGSPDMFVELILPEPAFAEFCRQNDVTMLQSGDDGAAHGPLEWRLRDAAALRTGEDDTQHSR